ncbi:MAG: biotin transporter BioY [Spirochaetes bacterium]|nr:biotin transporter BioY [Spirochaetota bacterium]
MKKSNFSKSLYNYFELLNFYFSKIVSIFKTLLKNKYVANTLKIISGVLIIALSAQINIHLPFSPVPFTMQVFSIILISMIYGFKDSVLTIFFYLFAGVINIPVFANWSYGIAKIFGPTGGYLIGFFIAGGTISYLIEKGMSKNFLFQFLAGLIGIMIIYIFGLSRLYFMFGLEKSLKIGFYPFILADVVKLILATIVYNNYRRFVIFRRIKNEINS